MIRNKKFFLLHFLLQFLTRPIRKHKQIISSFIQELISDRNVKILDFGCGEGIFSNIFENKKEIKYIGVDKDINFINFAKRVYKFNSYIVCNENLCFKNEVFDFIILNNVLHHMGKNEVVILLLEIKKIINKNGFLIIIELVSRNQQKGMFFKLVTYIEDRIKNINYYCKDFYFEFLENGFRQFYFEKISVNFIMHVFINNINNLT